MNRRWYDQYPDCIELIRQIQSMPQAEIRDFAAKVFFHVAEKLRKEMHDRDKKTLEVNSLGRQALQGLYKYGEERRRWYDAEPTLHKAIGLLYTLSPEGLQLIGSKLGDTLGLLAIYAQVCEQIEQIPSMNDLANITTTALQTGTQEAEELLISLVGQELYLSLDQSNKKS